MRKLSDPLFRLGHADADRHFDLETIEHRRFSARDVADRKREREARELREADDAERYEMEQCSMLEDGAL